MRRRAPRIALAALLLAALLLVSQADAAHHSVYRGKTSQKNKLQLSVSPGQITLIRFKARMLCRDGSLLHGDLSDFEATPLKRGGRFSDVQHGPTDTVSWQGRVKGATVSGTLRVTDRLQGGVGCDSGAVRFSARRLG